MKNLLLIITFLWSSLSFLNAQEVPPIINNDSVSAFLDKHYIGGNNAFLEMVYRKINYPKAARENCNSGISVVRLTFGKNGVITKFELLNPLGDGIEESVSKVINQSKKLWKSSAEGKSITFSLGFMMGEKEKLDTYIKIVAEVANDTYCYTTKNFQKKLDKAMKKKKYDVALAYCIEILKRNPWSEEHLKLYNQLVEKLNL